ncbi:MAG: transcription termination factor Rho, partial [Frankiales bacterium]|nr:transcription termination factor Rho [Frankiales bacterium]
MTDTTDVLDAPAQDSPAEPKVRRRATSGGGGLSALVLPQLQSLATDLGITGTAKMRKSQLIEAIQERQAGTTSNGSSSAAAKATEKKAPETTEAREAREDREDAAADSADDSDGTERPTRVDRGRERFLEREARRQEKAAALAAAGDDPEAIAAVHEKYRIQRDNAPREGGGDGGGQPRQRENREQQPRERQQQNQGPQIQSDDDEFGGRRGRFRERGRGRNRNGRAGGERFGNEPEPVISDDDVLIPIGGILDILDNYGFVRTTGYLTGPNDVYVSLQQVRKYGLRRGDAVTGAVRQQREGERKDKYNALVRLDTINGQDIEEARKRPDFTKLTPLYPQERLRLETASDVLTTRVIDLVMPIGKGQRALIVSPPKAGKTMVMQAIANAITTNNPECHLMVVLVDERPEEVTDMQRSVKGEVIASTFDRPPQDHITVAELSIERAKRLVELGHDVVVLLDNITRLGRAYNLGAPASGRILTGGVDAAALYQPKKFLG